jgi:hypothetical protein
MIFEKWWHKLIAFVVVWSAFYGAMFLLALTTADREQKKQAHYAVEDYYTNGDMRPLGVMDHARMILKPFESESCPKQATWLYGAWVKVHPCWIAEYRTNLKTYRWFVDLRREGVNVDRNGSLVDRRVRPLPTLHGNSENCN